MYREKSQEGGFTLIELLVVIAIIGILAAMLMPALEMARRKARETSCRAQLKQFDTALEMYKGSFANQAQQDGWPAWLSNLYGSGDLKSKQVFICPSDETMGEEGSRPEWSTWETTTGGSVAYTDQYRETDDLPSNETGSFSDTGDPWTYTVKDYGTDNVWQVSHDPYQVYMNGEYHEPHELRTDAIEACSYMYELNAAQCYWYSTFNPADVPDASTHGGNEDGIASWCEVKLTIEGKGVGDGEGFHGCVPSVRCFHHTQPEWKTENANREQTVLNLAIDHRVFACDGRSNAWQDHCGDGDDD